jgi:hypothetical protein
MARGLLSLSLERLAVSLRAAGIMERRAGRINRPTPQFAD